MQFHERVKKYEYKFTDTEDIIAEYIIKNKREVVNLPIRVLSDKFYTVPNTIIRLCKKMEYDGFSQLKNKLKDEIEDEDFQPDNNLEINIKKTLELIDHKKIDKVVNLFLKSENIIVYGIGQNIPLCEILSKDLKTIRSNVNYYNQRHEAFRDIHKLKENDLIFIISSRGNNQDILKASQIAKENNCKIIALTNISENKLQEIADINLYCYSPTRKVNNYEIADKVPMMIVLRALIEKYMNRV